MALEFNELYVKLARNMMLFYKTLGVTFFPALVCASLAVQHFNQSP
jgi:hypothetical protein